MANVGRLGNGGMISVGSLIKKIGDMVSVGGKVMLLLSSGMIPIAMDKQFGQGHPIAAPGYDRSQRLSRC